MDLSKKMALLRKGGLRCTVGLMHANKKYAIANESSGSTGQRPLEGTVTADSRTFRLWFAGRAMNECRNAGLWCAERGIFTVPQAKRYDGCCPLNHLTALSHPRTAVVSVRQPFDVGE